MSNSKVSQANITVTRQDFKAPVQLGFSLTEALIVITIMAVLIGVAAPAFKSAIERHKLENAVQQLYSDLSFARAEAMKQNKNVRFNFGVTDNSNQSTTWCYGLDDDSDSTPGTVCDCSDYYPVNTNLTDDYCKINTVDKTGSVTLHPAVTLGIVDNGAANAYAAINFDAFGKRAPLGVNTVITLTYGSQSAAVTVNEVGRISR